MIILAYPGTGKTDFYKNYKEKYKIVKMELDDFLFHTDPAKAYVDEIKQISADFILCSTQDDIIHELVIQQQYAHVIIPRNALYTNYMAYYRKKPKHVDLWKNMSENSKLWHEELNNITVTAIKQHWLLSQLSLYEQIANIIDRPIKDKVIIEEEYYRRKSLYNKIKNINDTNAKILKAELKMLAFVLNIEDQI